MPEFLAFDFCYNLLLCLIFILLPTPKSIASARAMSTSLQEENFSDKLELRRKDP